MYQVYILKSFKDSSYYIGHTNNLTLRLRRHNSGYCKFTKSRRPYELIYSENFTTRALAVRREKEIKSYKGGDSFKNLISAGGRAVNCTRL